MSDDDKKDLRTPGDPEMCQHMTCGKPGPWNYCDEHRPRAGLSSSAADDEKRAHAWLERLTHSPWIASLRSSQ